MWIALAIIAALATIVTVFLLLPVKIIIKNDENNQLILRYKFLFKTFGEDPDPNDPIIRTLKSLSGVDRLNSSSIQKGIDAQGLPKTLSETFDVLKDLVKEIVVLLKYCTVSRLHIKIRSTGNGADQAAIHYGQCSTVTYSLINALRDFVKIRKRGVNLDIGCDFFGSKPEFRYDIILVIRVARLLAGLWDVALAEAKRQETQQK